MVVNNFHLLKSLLDFPDDDTYYHLQIIKRRKENPKMSSRNCLLATFFIKDLEYFEKIQLDIINICNATRARAYLNLCPKSWKTTSLKTLSNLASAIGQESYRNHRCFQSAAGSDSKSGLQKRWIIDIDDLDWFATHESQINEILKTTQPIQDKVLAKVPTVNGIHIITTPFNMKAFQDQFKAIDLEIPDIHKNNPTVLYAQV